MTKVRASHLTRPAWPSKTAEVKTDAVLMASAGSFVERKEVGHRVASAAAALLRMGRPLRGRRCSGHDRTSAMRVMGEGLGTRRRCCKTVSH